MCIRDRGKYWALHVAMMGHEGKITKETVDELATVHGLDICLLYTSDAADDLLCVDLGGRRIIKQTRL